MLLAIQKGLRTGSNEKREEESQRGLRQLTTEQFVSEFVDDMPEEVFLFFIRRDDSLADREGVETRPSHLPDDVDPRVRVLFEKYETVFPAQLPKGEPAHSFRHRIRTPPGAEPYVRYPYRLSRPEMQEAETQIKDLIASGRNLFKSFRESVGCSNPLRAQEGWRPEDVR